MGKLSKIESRTEEFIQALEHLKKIGKAPSNGDLMNTMKLPSLSTVSEIKGRRQNIQPDAWRLFKNHYKTDLSEFNYVLAEDDLPEYRGIKSSIKGNLNMQAIVNLTESNKILAEAHKMFAESQHKYAEANLKLAHNNQQLIELTKATVENENNTQPAFDARYADLLELLADVASGKRYKSKQEVLALLSNMHLGDDRKKNVAGTQIN